MPAGCETLTGGGMGADASYAGRVCVSQGGESVQMLKALERGLFDKVVQKYAAIP
jgi:hypothetical protein